MVDLPAHVVPVMTITSPSRIGGSIAWQGAFLSHRSHDCHACFRHIDFAIVADEKLNPDILRLIAGYTAPPEIQPPGAPPGDPQISALQQYLHTKSSLSTDSVIVDVGSGRGAVAASIAAVWSKRVPPQYYAVDRAELLDELSLPRRIHNSSQKITLDDFYAAAPKAWSSAAIVVIRNVLHELDIDQTARLFAALSVFPSKCEIYIQDLATLPKGERGAVPWDPALLRQFLEEAGFATYEPVVLPSHSGNPWFFAIAHPPSRAADLRAVEESCARCRDAQKDLVLNRLDNLSNRHDTDSTGEFLRCQAEAAALAMQLQKWDQGRQDQPRRSVAGIGLVALASGPYDYALALPATIAEPSGLKAIVASKNLLDMPAMIRGSRRLLYFSGYSQHALFTRHPNRAALLAASKEDVDIRILIVAPGSEAARLRAAAPIYADREELQSEIDESIAAFAQLDEGTKNRIALRAAALPPPCSYFIIDELCVMSIYGQGITGSLAPCLIFKKTEGGNTYYSLLLQEFNLAWDASETVNERTE